MIKKARFKQAGFFVAYWGSFREKERPERLTALSATTFS